MSIPSGRFPLHPRGESIRGRTRADKNIDFISKRALNSLSNFSKEIISQKVSNSHGCSF